MANWRSLFFIKNGRNAMLYKNILYSMLIKVLSVLCSLIVVPLTLGYLNAEEYGVWLTLSSVLIWFSFFDVGLGNGLRNYLTQSISKGDYDAASRYLSTTFVLLCIMCCILFLIIMSLFLFVDLNYLFNVTTVDKESLRFVFIVAVTFALVTFVVKNVGVVYMAMQKYACNDFLIFLGHLFSLIIIAILTKFTDGSLLYVTLAFTASPVLIFLLAGSYLFISHPELRLSVTKTDFSLTRQLIGKGVSFFLIQITSCLVIYGSSNLFIAHYCGPAAVTEYNIAYKYFNVLSLGFTIMISPLWSAYTDAQVKGDYAWIRTTFYRSLKMWFLSLLAAVLMLLLSSWVYYIWIRNAVDVSFAVSASVCLYLCLFNFNNSVTYLLNGLNTIRVQLITSLGVTLLYLVLVQYMAPQLGIVGVSLAMSICYLIQGTIHMYQSWLIINNKAQGIWLR